MFLVCDIVYTFVGSVLNIILLFAVSTSLSVTITSSGSTFVGEMYSLLCSASVSDGESIPHIAWLRGENILLESNNTSSLTLLFPSLRGTETGNATYTGSETEFTLTGLQEAIGYEIFIVVVNNGLLSERSDPATVTTLTTGEC